MKWNLYRKMPGCRVLIGEYKSADYCRTMAMRWNRSESSMNLGYEFMIVDPAGFDYQESVNKHCWRMTWKFVEPKKGWK
jgi:hypothetical protein